MPNSWKPKIQAAYAGSNTNFCVALSELEYDDPFSAILYYDGSLPQPWGRVDVQREVTAVVAVPSGLEEQGTYAVLSNEGDVYFNNSPTQQEIIPGAGVARQGGRGAMYALGFHQGSLVAAGTGNQIYRRQPDGWVEMEVGVGSPSGYLKPGYSTIGSVGESELYCCGSVFTDSEPYDVSTDPAYSDSISEEELMKLFLKSQQQTSDVVAGKNPAGFGVYFDGQNFQDLRLGEFGPIAAVFAESRSTVWMVGPNGLILSGNAEIGFRDLSFHGDRNVNLLSITKFKQQLIVASDHGLHSFDGHSLSPLKPKLSAFAYPFTPTPLKVQAVGDVMFYFDYANHIHRWDGEVWQEIVIPPQLLERQFKRLPPSK